jgi:hypothetical protein
VLSILQLADVRVEREYDQRPEKDDEGRGYVEQHLQPEAGLIALCVVVDDRAHAVGAMQHGQPQHGQIPGLPEGACPATGDESEVDALNTAVEDVHDEQMTQDQEKPGLGRKSA